MAFRSRDGQMSDRFNRLVVPVAGLLACLAVAAGYGYYSREKAALWQDRRADLKTIARMRADQIGAWRAERLLDARLNSAGLICHLAPSLLDPAGNSVEGAVLRANMTLIQVQGRYQNVILARPDGAVLHATNPVPAPLDDPALRLVEQAIAARDAFIGELLRCEGCDPVRLDVAAPVLDDQQRPIAVLVLRIDPETVLFPLVRSWPTASPSAETLLVRKDGQDALLLNVPRHRADPPLTVRLPLSQTGLPAAQAALGRIGEFEGRDYRGVEVLAERVPVEGSPWFIVAKIDRAELSAELSSNARLIVLVVLLAVLALVAFAQVVRRNRILRVSQDLLRAERELREHEEQKFRALWQHMATASCLDEIVYEDGRAVDYRVLDVNPAFERILGFPRSRACGSLASELFGTPVPFLDTYARVAQTGEPASFEAFFAPVGRHLSVIVSCPGKGRFSTQYTDISQRKRAEALLLDSQRLLDRTQQMGKVGGWEFDIDTGIQVWTDAVYEIHEVDRTFQPTLKNGVGFYTPASRVVAEEAVRKAIDSGQPFDVELEIITAKGNRRAVHAIGEADPTRRKVFGFFQDITDRWKSEELLRQSAAKLRESQAEMERFLQTVSHDLKSPVVTVQTFLGYLEQDMTGGGPGQVEQDLSFIHAAIDRMVTLLDDLLELSRIGRVVHPPEPVSLSTLAGEALAAVAGRLSESGVRTQVVGPDVMLCGDRSRLVEIWQNLVENAVKFMGDQVAPFIEVGAEVLQAETVFFVRDNGIGIDPHFQPRLFTLFEKLDNKVEGSGMGLAIVKKIVETCGGRIWAESPGPGQGTTFRFTLPGAVEAWAAYRKPEEA